MTDTFLRFWLTHPNALTAFVVIAVLSVVLLLIVLSLQIKRRVQDEPPMMTTPRAQDAYVNGERVKVLAYADYDMAKVQMPSGVVTYVKRSKLTVF
jgi:hypothetical protein